MVDDFKAVLNISNAFLLKFLQDFKLVSSVLLYSDFVEFIFLLYFLVFSSFVFLSLYILHEVSFIEVLEHLVENNNDFSRVVNQLKVKLCIPFLNMSTVYLEQIFINQVQVVVLQPAYVYFLFLIIFTIPYNTCELLYKVCQLF